VLCFDGLFLLLRIVVTDTVTAPAAAKFSPAILYEHNPWDYPLVVFLPLC